MRYDIAGMTDAAQALGRPAPTWRGLPVAWLPPPLRLDRMFVGPRLTVEELHVGREYHGSDHCPLIAVLRLS